MGKAELSDFETLMSIDLGARKPKIFYFPWLRSRYWYRSDICILKNKDDLLTKWHELAHAYIHRISPELSERKFQPDPEKYFIGMIISEGVAEYMGIEAGLKGEKTKTLAEGDRSKRFYNNPEFLYKSSFVFSSEVKEIVEANKESKFKAVKILAKYLKSLEKSYYILGFNYVDIMIKKGIKLEELNKITHDLTVGVFCSMQIAFAQNLFYPVLRYKL